MPDFGRMTLVPRSLRVFAFRQCVVAILAIALGCAKSPATAPSQFSTTREPVPVGDGFLWKRQDRTSRDVILLVHGWNGDPRSTWDRLSRLMIADPYLGQFDVASFGYSTGCFGNHPRLTTVANDLRRFTVKELQQYDRIYLVAHSMGGLVAKRYIVDVLTHQGRGSLKVQRLLLAGTPNDGVRWYVTLFGGLLYGSQVADVTGAFRSQLDIDWRTYVENGGRQDIPEQYRQNVPVLALSATDDVLVPILSATSAFESEILDTTHTALKEPESRAHQAYRKIVNFLRTHSLITVTGSDWKPIDGVKTHVRDWRESLRIDDKTILSSHAVKITMTYLITNDALRVILEKSGEFIPDRGNPQSSLHLGIQAQPLFAYDRLHHRSVEPGPPTPIGGVPYRSLVLGTSFDFIFGFSAQLDDLRREPFCTAKEPYIVVGAVNNNDLVQDYVIRVYSERAPTSARLYRFDQKYNAAYVSEGTPDADLSELRGLFSHRDEIDQFPLSPTDASRFQFGRIYTAPMFALRDTYVVRISCDVFARGVSDTQLDDSTGSAAAHLQRIFADRSADASVDTQNRPVVDT